jgi:hypothetical protein
MDSSPFLDGTLGRLVEHPSPSAPDRFDIPSETNQNRREDECRA